MSFLSPTKDKLAVSVVVVEKLGSAGSKAAT
jgi:hypothetical protein